MPQIKSGTMAAMTAPADAGERTSVSILTGFLGAGKTTLVNHILSGQTGMRIAVIENEFGEVGVDDALVIETEEEVFEMNNGCICCTVRGDLLRILDKLSRRPKFDHILIETTGLADPAPVAQTFFVDDSVKALYELDAIITVVDAAHVVPHLEEVKPEGVENEAVEQVREVEVARCLSTPTRVYVCIVLTHAGATATAGAGVGAGLQVAFADKILLNKVDLVSEAQKSEVINKLRGINQFCDIIETTQSAVDLNAILGVKSFDLNRVLQFDEEFLNTEGEHTHDDAITSVGINFDGALDLGRLNAWLSQLLQQKGVDIFRSKGVLSIAGSEARYVFQGVHMLMGFSSSDDGVGRPWRADEKRENRLIFIGRKLDRADLTQNFIACLASPDDQAAARAAAQAQQATLLAAAEAPAAVEIKA